MATLLHLDRHGELDKFDAELGFRQQPMRAIFFKPGAFEAGSERLAGLESEFGNEVTPLEEWEALLSDFVAGEPLMVERQINQLHHFDHGIWELKTPEVRGFGWFPQIDHFICTKVDLATYVKVHGLYTGYRDDAIRFRDRLDLDPPKFVIGDDPRVVLSSIRYP